MLGFSGCRLVKGRYVCILYSFVLLRSYLIGVLRKQIALNAFGLIRCFSKGYSVFSCDKKKCRDNK